MVQILFGDNMIDGIIRLKSGEIWTFDLLTKDSAIIVNGRDEIVFTSSYIVQNIFGRLQTSGDSIIRRIDNLIEVIHLGKVVAKFKKEI